MASSQFVTVSEKDPLVIVKKSMKWDDIKAYIPAVGGFTSDANKLKVAQWGRPGEGDVVLHAQRCCARPCIAGSNGLFEYMAGEDEAITAVLAFGTTEVVKFFGTPGGKEVAAVLRPKLLRSCEVNFIVVGRAGSANNARSTGAVNDDDEEQEQTCRGYESISSEIISESAKPGITRNKDTCGQVISGRSGGSGIFKDASLTTAVGLQMSLFTPRRSEIPTNSASHHQHWEHGSPADPATIRPTFFNEIRNCDSKRDPAGSAPSLLLRGPSPSAARDLPWELTLRTNNAKRKARQVANKRSRAIDEASARLDTKTTQGESAEEVDLMSGSVEDVGVCLISRDKVFPTHQSWPRHDDPNSQNDVRSTGSAPLNDPHVDNSGTNDACSSLTAVYDPQAAPCSSISRDVPVDNSGFTDCNPYHVTRPHLQPHRKEAISFPTTNSQSRGVHLITTTRERKLAGIDWKAAAEQSTTFITLFRKENSVLGRETVSSVAKNVMDRIKSKVNIR